MDFKNIENIFAAFEMASLFGRFGDLDATAVKRLVPSIRKVIVRTLERRMLFYDRRGDRMPPDNRAIHAPGAYHYFGALIAKLRKRGDSIAILTFNYDIGIDCGLFANGLEVDYGLPRDEVRDGAVPLLKLHGSLNFGTCKKCGVVAWRLGDYLNALSTAAFVRPDYVDAGQLRLNVGSEIGQFRHCNHPAPCENEPVIVPPTWNKGTHYAEIQHVWQRAACELAEAENVFIAGYSWPNSDEFFHHLYALGSASSTLLLNFIVVDKNPDVAERYRVTLLGQQAQQRFSRFIGEFGEAIPNFIPETLRLPR